MSATGSQSGSAAPLTFTLNRARARALAETRSFAHMYSVSADAVEPLPPGWYVEPSERGTYYWREDGTVQWERPTTAAAAQSAHTTVQSSSTPDSIHVIPI